MENNDEGNRSGNNQFLKFTPHVTDGRVPRSIQKLSSDSDDNLLQKNHSAEFIPFTFDFWNAAYSTGDIV